MTKGRFSRLQVVAPIRVFCRTKRTTSRQYVAVLYSSVVRRFVAPSNVDSERVPWLEPSASPSRWQARWDRTRRSIDCRRAIHRSPLAQDYGSATRLSIESRL